MSLRELQALYRAGEVVMKCDEARPWDITHVSRASWFRFMASKDAPHGLCLTIGRRRLLSLPVFLEWIGALPQLGATWVTPDCDDAGVRVRTPDCDGPARGAIAPRGRCEEDASGPESSPIGERQVRTGSHLTEAGVVLDRLDRDEVSCSPESSPTGELPATGGASANRTAQRARGGEA